MHSEIVKKTYAPMHIRLVFCLTFPFPFGNRTLFLKQNKKKEPDSDRVRFFQLWWEARDTS